MKLKKIVSLAVAAVISASAISASAVVYIPIPNNYQEAIQYASDFYADGLYLEAKNELSSYVATVPPAITPVSYLGTFAPIPGWTGTAAQVNEVEALYNEIQFRIDRWNISEFLRQAEEFYNEGKYRQALQAVYQAQNVPFTTGSWLPILAEEYEDMQWWDNTILEAMGLDAWYNNTPETMDGDTAIKTVVDWNYRFGTGADLLAPGNRRFVAVFVDDDDNGSLARWDVYLQIWTPDGWQDLHAYNVSNHTPMTNPTAPTSAFGPVSVSSGSSIISFPPANLYNTVNWNVVQAF